MLICFFHFSFQRQSFHKDNLKVWRHFAFWIYWIFFLCLVCMHIHIKKEYDRVATLAYLLFTHHHHTTGETCFIQKWSFRMHLPTEKSVVLQCLSPLLKNLDCTRILISFICFNTFNCRYEWPVLSKPFSLYSVRDRE